MGPPTPTAPPPSKNRNDHHHHHRRANSFSGNAITSAPGTTTATTPTSAAAATNRRTSTTTTTPNRYNNSSNNSSNIIRFNGGDGSTRSNTASNLKLLGTATKPSTAPATSKTPPRSSSKAKVTKTPPRSGSKIAYKQQQQNRTPNRGGGRSPTPSTNNNKTSITPSRLQLQNNRPKRGMTPQRRLSSIPPRASSTTRQRQQQQQRSPAAPSRPRSPAPPPVPLLQPPPAVRRQSSQVGAEGGIVDPVTASTALFNTLNNYNGEGGEAIQVAIRMRPLMRTETSLDRVWKVVKKNNAVAQINLKTGELVVGKYGRSHNNKSFFVYDKAFDEKVSTHDVYKQTCQQIVQSATRDGKNGTIFAYGQTSSGKTYTMQGAEGLKIPADGGGDDDVTSTGGIVQLAASDIFNYINANSNEREYTVKASFVEIYNEEPRDLLCKAAKVGVREDRRKGVFMECKEEKVSDYADLLQVLSKGHKYRSFASTGMNEQSSRSHTIFRITIESRNKRPGKDDNTGDGDNVMTDDASLSNNNVEEDDIDDDDDDDDDDDEKDGNGALLVSSLTLVDLAGSESVRLTNATGERQKEGGKINRSLFALSRVIEALSEDKFVPYRDSLLTYILKPSLSGNARMAVICCATPSEQYLEETRSTLQFAARAKLVKTNAKSNEILDDQGMIRKLRKELKLAQQQLLAANGGKPIVADLGEMKKLQAGLKEADQCAQLYRTMYEHLFQSQNLHHNHHQQQVSETDMVVSSPTNTTTTATSRKRRLSVGDLALAATITTFTSSTETEVQPPASEPRCRPGKARKTIHEGLSPGSELSIVKSSHVAKNRSIVEHQQTQVAKESELETKSAKLQSMTADQKMLESTVDQLLEDKTKLQKEVDTMTQQEDQLASEKAELAERLARMEREKEELASNLRESEEKQIYTQGLLDETDKELESTIEKLESMEDEKAGIEKKQTDTMSEVQQLRTDLDSSRQEANTLRSTNSDLESKLSMSSSDIDQLTSSLESVQGENHRLQVDATSMRESLELAKMEHSVAQESIQQLQAENGVASTMLSDRTLEVGTLKESIESMTTDLSEERERASALKDSRDILSTEVLSYKDQVEQLQQQNATTSEELSTAQESFQKLQGEKEEIKIELSEVILARDSMEAAHSKNSEELSISNKKVEELEGNFATLLDNHEKTLSSWESSKSHLEAAQQRINHLEASVQCSEKAKQDSDAVVNQLRCNIQQLEATLTSTRQELSISNGAVETLEGEVESLGTDLQQMEEVAELTSGKANDLQAQVESLSIDLQEMEGVAESACNKANHLEASVQCLEKAKQDSDAEVNQLRCSIQQLEATLSSTRQELSISNGAVETLEGEVESLGTDLQQMEEVAELTSGKANDLQAQVESLSIDLQEMEGVAESACNKANELEESLSKSETKATDLELKVQDLVVQKDSALEKVTTLESEKLEAKDHLSTLESNVKESHEKLQATTTELAGLKEQYAKVVEEAKQLQADMEDNKDNDVLIADLRSKIQAFQRKENELADENANLTVENSTLQTQLNVQQSTLDSHMAQKDTLQQRLQETEGRLSTTESEKNEISNKLSVAEDELESVTEELLQVNEQFEGMNTRLNQLRQTINDLQDEVESKRQMANEQLATISEHERTIKMLNQELEVVQTASSTSSDNSSTVVMTLQKKTKQLENDNSDLKHRLSATSETIRSAREAESVAKLRLDKTAKKLNDVSSALSEREEELRVARSNQDAHSSHHRKEMLTLQRELEMERSNHTRTEIELKNQMGEDRRALMQEANSNQQNLQRELNIVQESLEESRNNAYATGEENDKLKDELSKKLEAIKTLEKRLEQSKKEKRKVVELKEENRQLSIKVDQLHSDLQLRRKGNSAQANKENGTDNDLQRRINDLSEELAAKDERIVHLESHKMTQEFVDKFKVTKNDLKKSKEEVAELRQKLDQANAPETAQLEFQKNALDSQLRKKSKECRDLEEEKNRFLKVLQQNKRSCSTDSSNIVKDIVSLCDHAASLEKERDSYANGGNRNELEIIKQENSVLRSQLNQCKQMMEESRSSESAYNAGVDNNQRVHYLEKENLQLLKDLKEEKLKSKQARREANILRIKGPEETDATTNQTKKHNKEPPQQPLPSSKRSHASDNGPSSFVQKPPIRGGSQRKHVNQNQTPNNENAANVQHKKAVDNPSSKSATKHIGSHRKEQRQRAPGLGEAGVPDDESDTQQCQQS